MTFIEKIRAAAEKSDSLVCVGLDTDPEKIPSHLGNTIDAVLTFNRKIIEATADYVCAYKPNSAFYEALGSAGIDILRKTCESIPSDIPVILDVKRGDIGNTASRYASFAYDYIGADAVTVNPYMGFDAVGPFLKPEKCAFTLCLTSNPSAADFQFLETGDGPLFETVARKAREWSAKGGIGLVAGATKPEHLGRIRELAGEMPVLVPGIGAQGGDVEAVVRECGGKAGLTIINNSRGVLYASNGPDFQDAARESLDTLRREINGIRRKLS